MAKSKSKSARKRRGAEAQRGGINVPVLPVVIVAGIAIVAAIVVFVVIQSGGSSSSDAAALAAEANEDTALPGTYVDLIEIYGGAYPASAGHVRLAVDYEADGNSNPPAGGPHWSGGCGDDPSEAPPFCGPAPRGIFHDEWPAATLVHNMEHGGVVIWYSTTDQNVIDEMETIVFDKLDNDDLIVMAPYSDMEEDRIALTSWSRLDKFTTAEYTPERVEEFIDTHMRRFNPEDF